MKRTCRPASLVETRKGQSPDERALQVPLERAPDRSATRAEYQPPEPISDLRVQATVAVGSSTPETTSSGEDGWLLRIPEGGREILPGRNRVSLGVKMLAPTGFELRLVGDANLWNHPAFTKPPRLREGVVSGDDLVLDLFSEELFPVTLRQGEIVAKILLSAKLSSAVPLELIQDA